MTTETDTNPIVWRRDLQTALGRSDDTIRRWLKAGSLPAPDINPTRECMAWRLSTLRNFGLNFPWPMQDDR